MGGRRLLAELPRLSPSDFRASVDVDDVSGDPARFLGCEEGDDAADVVWLS